jgi:hypothetical protein
MCEYQITGFYHVCEYLSTGFYHVCEYLSTGYYERGEYLTRIAVHRTMKPVWVNVHTPTTVCQ